MFFGNFYWRRAVGTSGFLLREAYNSRFYKQIFIHILLLHDEFLCFQGGFRLQILDGLDRPLVDLTPVTKSSEFVENDAT